ncbi:MAG TPA: hypothetical protein VLH16_08080, partial [Bacteroidales bacterium]|nr:hypothetical protein [Bacteroidales bacterium]
MKKFDYNCCKKINPYKSYMAGIVLVLTLFFGLSATQAQVVTTIPPFPTESDSVVIIFDATQGNGELANVTPPIYAHTGVITNLSTAPSAWRYVIAGWTQNTDKARMTSLGNNLYQLVIKPSIRSFYNVPPQEEILQMAFVFRNADGSRVGRNADGSDIFATVYAAGLNVRILSPDNATLLQPGQNININAVSNFSDSLFLYIGNQRVHTVAGNEISWNQTLNDPGRTWIKVVAKNDELIAADSVYCFVRGPVPVAALPADVINGINYIN